MEHASLDVGRVEGKALAGGSNVGLGCYRAIVKFRIPGLGFRVKEKSPSLPVVILHELSIGDTRPYCRYATAVIKKNDDESNNESNRHNHNEKQYQQHCFDTPEIQTATAEVMCV